MPWPLPGAARDWHRLHLQQQVVLQPVASKPASAHELPVELLLGLEQQAGRQLDLQWPHGSDSQTMPAAQVVGHKILLRSRRTVSGARLRL